MARAAVVTSTAAAPSVICDDEPAVCTPFSRATGFSFGELLERRLAQAFVARDVVRRAGGLAVVVDVGRVDRHDLALEAALGPRPLRALLRLEAERVAVGAGDAPLVGDALRALELRRELVVREVRLRVGRPKSPRTAAPSGTRLIDSTPQPSATSTTPRLHQRGREVGGLLRRAALAVDGGARDLERQAGARATRCGRC